MNNQIKRNLLLNTYLSTNSSPYFRRLALSQMNDLKNELYAGAIPLTITKEDIHQLIKEYAPIHWIHNEAFNFPINMEDIFNKFKLEKRGNDDYLIMKENLSSPSSVLPWFRGDPNNLKNVNSYIFVRPHPKGFALHFNVNFAYNTGKNVLNTRFGNHVYDATQSYIVFNENKEPILLGAQSHSHRPYWGYKNNSSMQRVYDRNNIYQEYESTHPVFFHGQRGSELYGFPIRYTYKKTALFKLRDYMNKGYKYDTGNKYVLIMPENYYGLSNIAENQDRQPVDLGIKELDIKNWPFEINYMGADKRGEVKIPFSKSQYRLTGPVHLKPDEFRIDEKRNNYIPIEYLDLKKKELGIKE